MSTWRNDMKCKYMFFSQRKEFPLKNEACKWLKTCTTFNLLMTGTSGGLNKSRSILWLLMPWCEISRPPASSFHNTDSVATVQNLTKERHLSIWIQLVLQRKASSHLRIDESRAIHAFITDIHIYMVINIFSYLSPIYGRLGYPFSHTWHGDWL